MLILACLILMSLMSLMLLMSLITPDCEEKVWLSPTEPTGLTFTAGTSRRVAVLCAQSTSTQVTKIKAGYEVHIQVRCRYKNGFMQGDVSGNNFIPRDIGKCGMHVTVGLAPCSGLCVRGAAPPSIPAYPPGLWGPRRLSGGSCDARARRACMLAHALLRLQ